MNLSGAVSNVNDDREGQSGTSEAQYDFAKSLVEDSKYQHRSGEYPYHGAYPIIKAACVAKTHQCRTAI